MPDLLGVYVVVAVPGRRNDPSLQAFSVQHGLVGVSIPANKTRCVRNELQELTRRRFTFPIGTFALSSIALAQELPSRFFRVIGAV